MSPILVQQLTAYRQSALQQRTASFTECHHTLYWTTENISVLCMQLCTFTTPDIPLRAAAQL